MFVSATASGSSTGGSSSRSRASRPENARLATEKGKAGAGAALLPRVPRRRPPQRRAQASRHAGELPGLREMHKQDAFHAPIFNCRRSKNNPLGAECHRIFREARDPRVFQAGDVSGGGNALLCRRRLRRRLSSPGTGAISIAWRSARPHAGTFPTIARAPRAPRRSRSSARGSRIRTGIFRERGGRRDDGRSSVRSAAAGPRFPS